MKVLIIEDDPQQSHHIQSALRENGFECDIVDNVTDGLDALVSNRYDLAIVDIRLKAEQHGGLEIVRKARARGNSTPVIYLTATTDPSIVSLGLDIGGDVYLTKPYEICTLISNVNALLRRSGNPNPGRFIRYEDLTIDTHEFKVTRGSRKVELSGKPLKLLILLASHPKRTYSKEDLEKRIWENQSATISNVVSAAVTAINSALCENGERKLVHNRKGIGYVFC